MSSDGLGVLGQVTREGAAQRRTHPLRGGVETAAEQEPDTLRHALFQVTALYVAWRQDIDSSKHNRCTCEALHTNLDDTTAALHRNLRVDLNTGPVKAVHITKSEWWPVYDSCGCGDTCPHEESGKGDTDHDWAHYGLPPCRNTFAFKANTCEAINLGAVAVTIMDAS